MKIKLEVGISRLPMIQRSGKAIEFESVSDAMVYADRAAVVCNVLLDSISSIRKQVKASLDEAPLSFYGSQVDNSTE